MAKKNKKRHSNSTIAAKKRLQAEQLADQKDRARKRMNPTARNVLLFDLVMLAGCILLEGNGMMPEELGNVFTLIGALLIPVALYFQFVKKDGGSSPRLK